MSYTLHNKDCFEILKAMPANSVDLLLTDPPYGIACGVDGARTPERVKSKHGISDNGSKVYGKSATGKTDYGFCVWDIAPIDDDLMLLARRVAKKQIIWGGNFYTLPPSRCWLIWDKENGKNQFADCELAWTNFDAPIRIKHHLWNGMLRKHQEPRFHPTQKPLDVIRWCLEKAGEVKTVIDPFMGSGTTGVVCVEMGLDFIGCEIEQKWFSIAERRIEQAARQGQLFGSPANNGINPTLKGAEQVGLFN